VIHQEDGICRVEVFVSGEDGAVVLPAGPALLGKTANDSSVGHRGQNSVLQVLDGERGAFPGADCAKQFFGELNGIVEIRQLVVVISVLRNCVHRYLLED
jgi:hypothetical protein